VTAIDRAECQELFETARRRLRTERRRTVDEREAFRAFESHVRKLDGQQTTTQPSVSTQMAVASGPHGITAVQNAYESTVMAVPHYEDDYDESFEEHITGEFGPEIATLVTQTSALGPQSKRTLLGAAAQAQDKREALVDALDAEKESFSPASRELLSVADELQEYEEATVRDASFGTLDAYRLRLSVLEETCEEIVETRQDALVRQRRTLSLPLDGPDVPTYVYQDLETTYPIVSTAATVLDRIETHQQAVEQALIYDQ
jgi:hypothetical protein